MWWWDQLIEKRIKTAQDQGKFDNLKGEGKPLPDDGSQPGERWAANHLLKQAGVLPDWLELRRQIHEERPAVVEAMREYQRYAAQVSDQTPGDRAILRRLEENYISLATAINRKIDEHNIRCPTMADELVRFPEDALSRSRAGAPLGRTAREHARRDPVER